MRLKTVLLLVLACALPSWAQQSQTSGNITSSGTTCSLTSVPTNCVVLQLDAATGAATLDIAGTFSATLQFEAFSGTTWTNINCTPPNSITAASSATAVGVWQCNVAGFSAIRVRASVYTSGTAAVVLNSAHASARSIGSPFASGGTTVNVIPKSDGAGHLVDSPLTAVDANTVKQANGTNAQTFQIFNTDDGAGNTEFANFQVSSNAFYVTVNKAGTGSARDLRLGTEVASNVFLRTNAANRWQVNSSGHLLGVTDNSFDIGATGATRPRTIYAATSEILETAANGAQWIKGSASELLTLSTSGTTTDTAANLLPANSIIEAVTCRITTTITTATNWSVGDATTAARFSAANATLTANTTSVGIDHWSGAVTTLAAGPTQAAAAKVRITTTGTPGAGIIRITVFYRQIVAPTS